MLSAPGRDEILWDAKRKAIEAEQLLGEGKYRQALPLLLQALRAREERLGPGADEVLRSLDQLREIYEGLGERAKAEQLSRRLARQAEAVRQAATLNQQCLESHWAGKYAEGQPLCARALKLREEALGTGLGQPSDPHLRDALKSPTLVRRQKRRLTEDLRAATARPACAVTQVELDAEGLAVLCLSFSVGEAR